MTLIARGLLYAAILWFLLVLLVLTPIAVAIVAVLRLFTSTERLPS